MTITIAVAGRIATATATTQVVAGNTYPVAASLDSEWTGNLFMRVRFGSLYYDIPFASTDTAVNVQFPVGYPEVGIGIFSEALQVCTNEVRVKLLRSILEAGEQVVEFDGDLYDQWEGEVTALLTDDAFDATSTRPVQNAVITAWKDTVALDADVVHKTGNETVAGIKTFEGQGIQAQGSNAYVTLKSTQDASAQSWKGNILCYDRKDGADSEIGRVTILTANGFNSAMFRVSKPDRSASYSMEVRAYPEYSVTMVQPFYPVDGQGNPTYLTANALMASGNIAVDPRIVHTTGNQAIAGTKAFNNAITHAFRRLDGYVPIGQYVKLLTLKNNVRAQVEATIEAYKCIGQIVVDTVPKTSAEQKGGWYVVDPSGWLNGKVLEFFVLYNTATNGIEVWGHSDTAVAFRINGVRADSGNVDPTAANLDLEGATQAEDPRLDTTTYPDGAFPIAGRIIGGS
ncbi:MAG: hypothetical protein IKF98_13455 [Clostridia bacterium]|nr:hypothetical protein [Clostridia bacterium]